MAALAGLPREFLESRDSSPAILAAIVGPVFNVREFGAIGDGKAMDTRPIQSAIHAANQAGGGVVLLPAGTYLSGTLLLKSKVDLHLEANATLLGSASRSDYQAGYWYALLLAEGQDDIAISGSGIINGQGRELAQDVIRRVKQGEIIDPMGNNRPSERQRPQLVEFRRCRGVGVTGVTLRDSACWVQNYIQCQDLLIDRIRVDSTAYWNNDGIDVTDCKTVRVTNCDINSADDGICLKSNSAGPGCEDVEVSACRIRSSACAFKCGTASHGGFHNIRVHDLLVYDTYRSAVALESVDGGVFKNVRVENVRANKTGNAIFLRLGHRNPKAPIGQLEDIVIRDVRVEVPSGAADAGYETPGPPTEQAHNLIPSSITGLPNHPVRDVVLQDVEVIYAGGGTPERAQIHLTKLNEVPEQAQGYPEFSMFGELPAWGLYVRHAHGIAFRNFRICLKQKDFRPAMVFDDVRGLRLERVYTGPVSGTPVILLNDVPEAILRVVDYPKGSGERLRLTGNSSLLRKSRSAPGAQSK
jgi:polygalacturonase